MSEKSELASAGTVEGERAPGAPVARVRRNRQESQVEKRALILRAAKTTFERSGYDGASMSDIATEAGVSKPTLYVYFDSKERLFDALIEEVSCSVPESVLVLDVADPDIESQLVRCGVALMEKIARPEKIDLLRVVVGAAGKFPEVGQKFFAAGPGRGIEKLRTFLAAMVANRRLEIPDVELAAFQLLELIQSVHLRRMLFRVAEMPTRAEIERTVASGVRVFLAAHRPTASVEPETK